MILKIIGTVGGISFIGRIIFQIFLDGVSYTDDGKRPRQLRIRYFMPYYEITPPKLPLDEKNM